uniref:Uncharacterized protein n=1 Tax=Ascaris lumbricoides TaxID=6252 RepID=A0A0M3HRP5_ASCLU
MRSGVLRKVESASQRARSHSRMRASQRTAWGSDFDTDNESIWDRNHRTRTSRNRCPNDFDQHEFDSFFKWVMERESSQPQQRRVIADEEHDKRIAQIRHLLFK